MNAAKERSNMNRINISRTLALIACSGLISGFMSGCAESEEPTEATTGGPAGEVASNPAASTPAWMLTTAPVAEVRTVGEAKPTAVEGDRVAIRGRIGGTAKPIAVDVAVFHIVDPALKACSDVEGDQCRTPWDYCCEPQDSLQANTATVQIMNADGQLVEQNIETAGLSPLDEVVVVGTVGPRPNENTFVIQAEGIYKADG